MLRLRAQVIRRLGTSHVYPACLNSIARSSLAPGLSHPADAIPARHHARHGTRSLTTSPASATSSSDAPEKPAESLKPEAQKPSKKNKKRRKTSRQPGSPHPQKTKSGSEARQEPKDPEHEAPEREETGREETERKEPERKQPQRKQPQRKQPQRKQPERKQPERKQPERKQPERKKPEHNKDRGEDQKLKRLQGALAALQNVLTEQNIQVNRPKNSKKRPAKKQQQTPDDSSGSSLPESGDVGAISKHLNTIAAYAMAHKKPRQANATEPGKDDATANAIELGKDGVDGKLKPKPKKKKKFGPPLEIESLDAKDLNLVPIHRPQPPVPGVSYGLNRVLFNPGVYRLQDPRSRVYNFDPYLAKIMPIQEFDFDALKQYVTSSKDETLIGVAREHMKTYTGSTSSMSSMLSHFHYLLSSWREINSKMLSAEFEVESKQFTKIMRAPAAVFLHYKDGVYAIDADKEFDTATILSMLGKSMEKLLTLPKEEYERYRHINSDQITEEERNADEAFHYTGLGDFMMRSQLDAYDRRLPGTGMYDLKTRAVLSIRMSSHEFEKGLGYEIRWRHGKWQSFEREYHDMIRAAFLKYSLQVRMGRMDGIFVAYHNTERIFGFQYVPLEDMDYAIHGTYNKVMGDREFKFSLALLNKVFDRAKAKFPKQSLRIHFETRPSEVAPFMYIFAKPVVAGEIEAVQQAGKASIEQFEREVLGIKRHDQPSAATDVEHGPEGGEDAVATQPEESQTPDDASGQEEAITSWEEIQSVVETAVEDDELGIGAVREAIEGALAESRLLEVQSPGEARRYVEALLSAVTNHLTPSRGELTDASESNDARDEGVEAGAESHQSTSQEESAAVPGGTQLESPEKDEHGVSDVSVTSSEQTPVRGDSESSEMEEVLADAELSAKDKLSSSPSISALKTLILSMAQNIDEKLPSAAEKRDDDSSKLQEFEEILRRLIVESRQSQEEEPEAKSDKLGSTDGQPDLAASPARSDASATEEGVDGPTESASPGDAEAEAPAEDEEILGMVLTIRNKFNGSYVRRTREMDEEDKWVVEYNIEELPPAKAQKLYEKCKTRRHAVFTKSDPGAKAQAWAELFGGQLKRYTELGREYRERETERAKTQPVWIMGDGGPKTYEEVFGLDEDVDTPDLKEEEVTDEARAEAEAETKGQ